MANMYPSKKAGGGGGTETVLWTNPSPTASLASNKVNLSSSLDNFDDVKVEYVANTSSQSVIKTAQWPVSALEAESYGIPVTAIASWTSSGKTCVRCITAVYNTPTQIRINACQQAGVTGTYNTEAVPLKIIGIKY